MGDHGIKMSNRFAALEIQTGKPRPAAAAAPAKPAAAPKPAAPKTAPVKKPAAPAAPAVGAPGPSRDLRGKPKSVAPRKDTATKDRRSTDKGPASGEKRVFDKYSHSGKGQVAKEGKRAGSGPRNWGVAGSAEAATALEDAKNAKTSAAAEEKADAVASSEQPAEVAAPTPVEDEGPPVKTYDEFLAEQEKEHRAVKKASSVKVRAAGEGQDGSAWADFKPLVAHDLDTGFTLRPKKDKKAGSASTGVKEERVSADKLFRVLPPRAERPERAERPARGGRGDRGDRPPRTEGGAPRGDRPPRAEGAPRGDRPPRAEGAPRAERPPRTEGGEGRRPRGEGRAASSRSEKAVHLDDQKAFPGLK